MRNTVRPRQEPKPTRVSDEELVGRAQAGDPSAFDELVRHHGPGLYRLARHLCHGHAEDAEETSQNALLNAYRHLAGFRGESQFSTWLTRIVINECLLYRRRQRKERHWVPLDERLGEKEDMPAEVADGSDDPEEEYAWREFQAILDQCLAKLPDLYRTPFISYEMKGLSYQEIAARLSLSMSATKSRVLRARLQLQRCLREHFCPGEKCYWPGSRLGPRAPLDRALGRR